MNQCDIVQDLLPLYVEGLTRMASSELIEDHLKTCPECSAALEEMSQPIEANPSPKNEVDYLKKIRKKSYRTAVLLSISSLIVITLLAGLAYLFVIGQESSAEFDIDSYYYTFSAESNTVTLNGKLRGNRALARVKVYPSSMSNSTYVKIYNVYPSFLHRDPNFSVTLPYTDDLYIELQGDGDRQLLFDPRWVLPTIYEVEDDVTTFVRHLETREMWGEIEAIFAAASDTGVLSSWQGLQSSSRYCFSMSGSGGGPVTPVYTNIFVYERDGNYYSEAEGENVRQLTAEQYDQIRGYVERADVSMEVVEGDVSSSVISEVAQ
jgi:hypothetical protein